MHNRNIPTNAELPSSRRLLKSTIAAILIAAVILVTVVLPAEYGVDPVGIGDLLGLTSMGQIKASLAQEAAADNTATAANEPVTPPAPAKAEPVSDGSTRSDAFSITLAPGEGKEIKLTMAEGASVQYAWYTDGGKANFDAHADSKELEIKYHNYEKGKLQRSEGTLAAAFDGNHGWFWRNRTTEAMTVTLEVSGPYTDVFQY